VRIGAKITALGADRPWDWELQQLADAMRWLGLLASQLIDGPWLPSLGASFGEWWELSR